MCVREAASSGTRLLPCDKVDIALSAEDRQRFEAFLKVHPDELHAAARDTLPAFDTAVLLGVLVVALGAALALLAGVWHVYGADVQAVLAAQGDAAGARSDTIRCSASCIALGGREAPAKGAAAA